MNMWHLPMGIVTKNRNKLKLWQENTIFTWNWHAMTVLVYKLYMFSMDWMDNLFNTNLIHKYLHL